MSRAPTDQPGQGPTSGRPKRPESVRAALLRSAADLAAEQGIAAMSVQAVAERAKVTKGGLYHHFPSKDALIDGMFEHLLSKLDAVIDALMEQDPQPTGSFTRAYVDSTLLDEPRGIPRQWSALVISMAHEPRLQRRWFEWLAARLERHKDTDGSADHELVRLAADGAWLSLGLNPSGNLSAHAAQLRERLHQLTRA